jgi:hypothetical protein
VGLLFQIFAERREHRDRPAADSPVYRPRPYNHATGRRSASDNGFANGPPYLSTSLLLGANVSGEAAQKVSRTRGDGRRRTFATPTSSSTPVTRRQVSEPIG